MPYIKQEYRVSLDPLIDQLAEEIVAMSKKALNDAAFAGYLNYVCTRLALKIIKLQFGKMRYWIVALVTGVFKNASDEFYRRAGVPYEDIQIRISGDVDLYSELDKQCWEERMKLPS